MDKDSLKDVERLLRYDFDNKNLLKRALTHSSYANLHKSKSNERLEFFGDSILEFVVSEFLIETLDNAEGDLSKLRAKLVNSENLSKISERLGVLEYVRVGANFKVFSTKFKADVFESIVGAIYLDGGLDEAVDFIYNELNLCEETLEDIWESAIDYKTRLQEELQKNGKVKIEYKTISESGPAHSPLFKIQLIVNGEVEAESEANNKKDAEQSCAKIMISKIVGD